VFPSAHGRVPPGVPRRVPCQRHREESLRCSSRCVSSCGSSNLHRHHVVPTESKRVDELGIAGHAKLAAPHARSKPSWPRFGFVGRRLACERRSRTRNTCCGPPEPNQKPFRRKRSARAGCSPPASPEERELLMGKVRISSNDASHIIFTTRVAVENLYGRRDQERVGSVRDRQCADTAEEDQDVSLALTRGRPPSSPYFTRRNRKRKHRRASPHAARHCKAAESLRASARRPSVALLISKWERKAPHPMLILRATSQRSVLEKASTEILTGISGEDRNRNGTETGASDLVSCSKQGTSESRAPPAPGPCFSLASIPLARQAHPSLLRIHHHLVPCCRIPPRSGCRLFAGPDREVRHNEQQRRQFNDQTNPGRFRKAEPGESEGEGSVDLTVR
jgi:hypothetical protein